MQEKPLFSQLFPQPSGKNGYEDLMRAADLLRQSLLVGEAEEKKTLISRRRALSDPPVRQARALLEMAFLKPVAPPVRESLDSVFPDLAGLRSLARLLSLEVYVLCSEGRTLAALQSLALGLRLGRVPKSLNLIGGLVGVAVGAILLKRIFLHLEQLTVRDCDRLLIVLHEHLEADADNAMASMMAEGRTFVKMLEPIRKDFIEAVEGWFEEPEPDEETGAPPDPREVATYQRARQQIESLRNNTAGQSRMLDAVHAANQAQLRAELEYLSAPHRLVAPPAPLPSDTLERALFEQIAPVYQSATNRFIQDRINCQLLGVHAAIKKYKWEWEKLPESLEALKLGDSGLDPYTRQPFRYEKKGETYELFSVGPLGDQGKRTPIYLPQRKN